VSPPEGGKRVHLLSAEIHLVGGLTFSVLKEQATEIYQLYQQWLDETRMPNIVLEENNRQIMIHGDKVLYISFEEDPIANGIEKQITDRWSHIQKLTNV
jgi:hypothetical protein